MSELAIFASRITVAHDSFCEIQEPFCRLLIETEDERGNEDVTIKVFLDIKDGERMRAAVTAFNEVWEKSRWQR